MAERATVFQQASLATEVTPGVRVPATRRVLAVSIEPKPMIPTVALRNMGSKFTTATFNKKEWTQADMKGEACFQTLAWLFSSILTTAVITTPGGGTNSRLWTFTPNTYSPDNPVTFSIESGSSAGAERFQFGTLDSIALRYTKDEVGLSGTWFGTQMEEQIALSIGANQNEIYNVDVGTSTGGTFTLTVGDDTITLNYNDLAATVQTALQGMDDVGAGNATVTGTGAPGTPWVITFTSGLANRFVLLTGSGTNLTGGNHTLTVTEFQRGSSLPLDLTPVPIDPTQMEFLVSNDGVTYTLLDRVFEAEWALNGRFSQVMTLDDTKTSFSAIVEKPISPTMTLVLEHNSVAAGYMADLRAKTEKWMRILATGPLIEGSLHYLLQIDFPFHFKDNSRGDKGDVWTSTYHLEPVYDPNWQGGAALQVKVQNILTALP